ncbi:hypothetical protein [Rickettsiella endosymbiont of Xylota segnis]|uniref:hypothetical protein n=1 Tax=Rickettsiella endosymbiont of Xylota segnis TaxID=3066238 RepID=UPI0030CC68B4
MPILTTTKISTEKLQEIINLGKEKSIITEELADRLTRSIESINSDGEILLDDEQLKGLIKIQEVRVNQRTTKSFYKEIALNTLRMLALTVFIACALVFAFATVALGLGVVFGIVISPLTTLGIIYATFASSAAGVFIAAATFVSINPFPSPSLSDQTEIETLSILKNSMEAMELMDETKIASHDQKKSVENHSGTPHNFGSFFQKTTNQIDASNEQLLSETVPHISPSSVKI